MKPELCRSETMALCSAEVERTFIRLWTQCDDDGRAIDNTKLLKGDLFPLHDDVTAEVIDGHLQALASLGLIQRYEVVGKRYLEVTSWHEHQHPQKSRPSVLPPRDLTVPRPLPTSSDTPTVVVPEEQGPVGVVGVVDGVVDGVGDGAVVAVSPSAPEVDHFTAWYKSYPRKRKPRDAQRAFEKAIKRHPLDLVLERSALHFAAWSAWPTSERQYIPYPASFLNADDFLGEPELRQGQGKQAGNRERLVEGVEKFRSDPRSFAERALAATTGGEGNPALEASSTESRFG